MAVIRDTDTGGYSSGAGNTGHSYSIAIGNNPNRRAIAVVMSDEIPGAPAFTIGGVSMTLLRATSALGVAVVSFYLSAPIVGTPTVVFSCNSTFYSSRTRVWSLYNAKQFGVPAYGEATGASSVPTVTLPTNDAVDYLCMGEAENNPVGVTPSGWTERVNLYAGLACDRTGGVSGSVGFTTSMSQWAVQCVDIKPFPGGGGAWILAARRWQEFMKDLRRGLVPPDALRSRYRDLVTV